MNRDLDDRLVPPGEYRDALNVGIGRSEGSDVGAVENLKGNELVTGQDDIEGTTIGSVRDPNTNNIYWFTKGDTVDAIYEYDGTSVNTILKDSVTRENVQPTCAPTFVSSISDPASDSSERPDLPDFPPAPRGGCTMEFGPNGRRNSNYDAGAAFDDGSCMEEPPVVASTDPTAVITGVLVGRVNSDHPLSGSDSLSRRRNWRSCSYNHLIRLE